MFHPKIISRILGLLLLIEAAFLLTAFAVALFYDEHDLKTYLYSLAAMVGTGTLLAYIGKGKERNVSRKDGYIVVTLCWVFFSLFAAIPYILSGHFPTFTDAFFEAMSGFSTTGSTVVNNVEALPHSILFWRAMTHWVGGLGIVFFTVAVFPVFGLGDINLFSAESAGLMRTKLHPRISVAARWILTTYIGLTILATVSFYFAGMGKFDALCHAMSAVSTGGFSTKQASIATYNSPLLEYVVTAFMFLGGVNFSLLYLSLFKGRIKDLLRDSEFRVYVYCGAFFTFVIAVGLFFSTSMSAEESFRASLFQVISLQTTTGFATANYVEWLPILWFMLSAVMYLGACTGSTCGAIKSARTSILSRVMFNEFKRIIHPNAVLPVRLSGRIVPAQVQSAILAYIVIYFAIVVVGVFVNMTFGLEFLDAYGLSVSTVGNVGPALGNYGPMDSLTALPDAIKWFCSFQMLVGRLEFFAVLLLLIPAFWKRQ